MAKTALLVLGMHRSGTSAVTGVLGALGVPLGRRLFAAHAGVNDKGYFENAPIASLNDEILCVLGSSWDDFFPIPASRFEDHAMAPYLPRATQILERDFSDDELFAVKDPRMCRLLPWWLSVLRGQFVAPVCLLMARHPFEVADSLTRRDGFSREKGLMLWLEYVLAAEFETRGLPRTVMTFNQLLARPLDALSQFEADLGVTLPSDATSRADQVATFLSASLRHHASPSNTPTNQLERLCLEVMQALDAFGPDSDPQEFEGRFDAYRARRDALLEEIPEWIRAHIAGLSRRGGNYHLTWLRVRRSWSHRYTRAIRHLERKLGRPV